MDHNAKLFGLLAGIGVFVLLRHRMEQWFGAVADEGRKLVGKVKGKAGGHSPTPSGKVSSSDMSQVKGGVTTPDTMPVTPWSGDLPWTVVPDFDAPAVPITSPPPVLYQPGSAGRAGTTGGREAIVEWMLTNGGMRTTDLIATAMSRFGVSESTAQRALRTAKARAAAGGVT